MKTKFILVLAVLSAAAVSCRKQKLEKELDGTYTRAIQNPTIYSDSTSQVFFEASTVDFDRKAETFAWGGVVTGREEVTIKKSDRDKKNELEVVFESPNWESMLPMGADPNESLLEGTRFYLLPDGNSLQFSIVYPNSNEIKFYYTRQ